MDIIITIHIDDDKLVVDEGDRERIIDAVDDVLCSLTDGDFLIGYNTKN